MDEEGNKTGLWIGLIVAVLVAAVFIVLWYLRGGEIGRLAEEMRAAQTAASSATQRLESDLRSARNDMEEANRRVAQTETRLRDEARRAADLASQTEQRLRSDADATADRLRAANAELKKLRDEAASRVEAETAGIREELDKSRAELEELRASGRDEAAKLAADLAAAKSAIVDHEEKAAAAARELASRDEELARLRDERESRLSAADAAVSEAETDTDAERLRPELERLTRELVEAQNKGVELEANVKRLTEELEKARREATAREEELLETIDSLTGPQTGDAGDVSGEAVAAYKSEIEKLQREVKDLLVTARQKEAELTERLAHRKDECLQHMVDAARRQRETEMMHAAEKTVLLKQIEELKARGTPVASVSEVAERAAGPSGAVAPIVARSCFEVLTQ